MKTQGAVADKNGVVKLIDVELPTMSDTRVCVETWLSGVSCGTEGDTVSGRANYLSRPCLLGYEAVGRVVEAGAKVSNLRVGDLVFTTGGGLWPCENCFGGSHARRSVAESKDVVKLNPDIPSPLTASYAHLAAVAAEGLSGMKLRKDAVLLVFGLGMLGQMSGKLAQLQGARVIGINRSAWKREAATALGFDGVAELEPAAIKAAVEKLGLGVPNFAVETTGKGELFEMALSQLTTPAEVTRLGYTPDKYMIDYQSFAFKQLTLHGSVGGGNHIPGILQQVEKGQLNLESLIRHIVAPSGITDFYADLVGNHSRYLGAVIDWSKK